VLETELKLRVVVPVLHPALEIEVMKVAFEDAPASQRRFGFWLRLVLDKHTAVICIRAAREPNVGAIIARAPRFFVVAIPVFGFIVE